MAISIDTTRPLRRPLELAALVEAVEAALPADESSWIEWKTELDLRNAAGAFKTARAILSFANRMPDAAEKTCGGLAYFLLGAEPANVPGTPEIDPADLEQALLKYLGADGPVWSPHYVIHAGVTVLVIVVEAPQWGDPIHTLRRTHGSSDDGTVFVRSQARSRPANSAELRMLQVRLLRGAGGVEVLAGLEVTCTIREPNALLVIASSSEMVDEWLEKRRTAITAWQESLIEADAGKEAAFFRSLVNTAGIEDHLEECRARLFDAQRRRVFENGWSRVSVSVFNPGARILEDVELTLHIDGEWSAMDTGSHDYEDLKELPAVPRLRNPAAELTRSLHSPAGRLRPLAIPRALYFNPNIDIEPDAITLQLGQLRPEKPRTATEFSLVLHREPEPADSLSIPWSATSPCTTGMQRGVLQVPVETRRFVLLEAEYGISDNEESPR